MVNLRVVLAIALISADSWRRKVCRTALHDCRAWVVFVESGNAIGRWFPLTHKQPVWGQGHRCCLLHNQVESGPENERGIEINGGRGRTVRLIEGDRGIHGTESRVKEREKLSRKWMFTEASTLDSCFNERIREAIKYTYSPYALTVTIFSATTLSCLQD